MNQLLGCLKKELLEAVRTKRLMVMLILGAALMLFCIVLSAIWNNTSTVSNNHPIELYASSFGQYYGVLLVCFAMGSVSKEVKKKKLVIPLSNGMKSENIIAAKFIVHGVTAFVTSFMFFCICLGIDVAMCEYGNGFVQEYMINIAIISFNIFLTTILTVALSALTKNSAVAAIISLFILIFAPIVFSSEKLITKVAYTPFLFFLSTNKWIREALNIENWQYLLCLAEILVIYATLIIFAIKRRNILFVGKN